MASGQRPPRSSRQGIPRRGFETVFVRALDSNYDKEGAAAFFLMRQPLFACFDGSLRQPSVLFPAAVFHQIQIIIGNRGI